MKSPVKGWSDAKFKGWIVALLRRGTMRYPPKNETLAKAKTTKKINASSGRLAQHYKCKGCKKEFPMKQVVVDHIKPVVDPKVGFIDWNTYIERMYCVAKNFQVLCKPCHLIKSAKERKDRRR